MLALTYKGSPIFVMPLVFGFAPVVNTIVTMWLGKTYKQMTPIFVVGLIMVALGAVGVLMTKPSGKPAAAKTADVTKADQASESKDETKTEPAVETKSDSSDEKSEADTKPTTVTRCRWYFRSLWLPCVGELMVHSCILARRRWEEVVYDPSYVLVSLILRLRLRLQWLC